MSTIASHLSLARRGINKIVDNIVRDPKGSYAPAMGFKDITTTEQFYRTIQKSGLGVLTNVNEGDPHPEADFSTMYQKDWYWAIYKLKYSLTREKALSDQYMTVQVPQITKMLRDSIIQTENVLAAGVFNNGTSTATDYVNPDGLANFSYAHTLATGTSSNRGNGSSDADLSASELANAITYLMQQVAHKGEPFLAAGPYTLIVHPSNFVVAKVLKDSGLLPGSHNNDVNVQGGMIEAVVTNPYLTDTDSWFMVDKAASNGGLHRIVFSTEADVETWDDPDKGYVHHGASIRRQYGCNHWRGLWGSYGA